MIGESDKGTVFTLCFSKFKELKVWTSEAEAKISCILAKDKDLQAELEIFKKTKVVEIGDGEFNG